MTVKDRKSQLVLTVFLGVLAALAPLSIDMYLPSLPYAGRIRCYYIRYSAYAFTMTMAGMAIGQIFAGPISDMKGRRIPLVFGMVIFVLSTVVCVFATTIDIFLVFRFIQGLAGAVGIVR